MFRNHYERLKDIYKKIGQFNYINQINEGEIEIEPEDDEWKEESKEYENLNKQSDFIEILVVTRKPLYIRGIRVYKLGVIQEFEMNDQSWLSI